MFAQKIARCVDLGQYVVDRTRLGWDGRPDFDEAGTNQELRRLRARRNLLKRIKLIWAVQSGLQKHSVSGLTQIKIISLAIPSHMRGVSRSSRT
jgi:hypothetical protein